MAPKQVIRCMAEPHEIALDNLRSALAFYDRVNNSSDDEKIAVGTDHIDGVFAAARDAARHAPKITE